jgi:PAS domain S-box-containing protein
MKDKIILKNQKIREPIESPIRLLIVIIFSIFAGDILIGILIKAFPIIVIWNELLVDSILLLIIIFPVIFIFVFRPLTKILRESKLVHEEILKLHRAIESSGEAIFVTDRDGLITYINPEFTNLYGYTAGEVIGKTTPRILKSGVMSAEDYKYFWNTILHKEVIRGELINKTKDSRLITIEGSANPILNDQKEIIGFIGIQHDITIQKRAEEKIEQGQYLMNVLLTNLPDHIYFKDRESRFTMINKALAQFLGLNDPDQAVGKTDFDFFTGEHAQQAYEDEQNIIRTGQPLSIEEKETHPDSPNTWASTIKLPLHDKEGNIIGTFGISRDITERQRRDLESHALYEIRHGITTTSNLDELLKLIHKSLGKVVYAENCFVALHNQQTGLFSFPYFVDKVDPTPMPTSMGKSCTAYVFHSGKPFLFTKGVFNHLKEQNEVELVGSPSPSWVGIPLQTPSRIIGVLVLQHYEKENAYSENDLKFLTSIGNQIAFAIERKQTETALLESERDLNESQKIAGLGSYKLDFRTGIWTSSDILDSIFGIDEKYDRTVTGWTELIHPSWRETMSEYLRKDVIENHNRFDKEYKIIRNYDGNERWVHGQGELIFDSNKNLNSMIGTIMDITERKMADEEIKLKNGLLQASNAEKDKFFSIIAHDLRGPLSAFVGATQIITEEIHTMNIEEIIDITMSMKTSASNIYSLLENILEWSRLRRGGMDFVPEILNLKEKIGDCIDVLSESARKKRIQVTFSIPDEMEVFADNHMFDTIIRNLISNAIKFTPVGGNISLTADYNNDHSIVVKVSDSGIGMTPELINKLFLISEKTSRPGTEGEMSTGLGLLLVKEFIEKHGGKIWVKSEVGNGSTFSFTIKQR